LFPEVEETLQAENLHKLSRVLMNFTVKKVESSQQVTLTKVSVIDNNQFAKLRVSEKEREREKKSEVKPKKLCGNDDVISYVYF
jgi:hypothetical protein